MPRMKIIKDTEMTEEDRMLTDVTIGSSTNEQIFVKRWEDFVNCYDDGSGLTTFEEKEIAIMGMLNLTSKWDSMTLAEAKIFRSKVVRRQCDEAWEEDYPKLKRDKAISEGIKGKTATKFVNWDIRIALYETAKQTALDAITACTAKEQVRAISFVPPA
jgi:hypothetical protein